LNRAAAGGGASRSRGVARAREICTPSLAKGGDLEGTGEMDQELRGGDVKVEELNGVFAKQFYDHHDPPICIRPLRNTPRLNAYLRVKIASLHCRAQDQV
jgi:hypothetical protein